MSSDKLSQNDLADNKDIEHFIEGYREFRSQYFPETEKNSLFRKLVKNGQNPKTMVIACSDSRVDPSIILQTKPGELFVVRNVANLVPPCDNNPRHHGTSSALEFAVLGLKVKHIIVFGHSYCGGIRALLDRSDETPKQNSFVDSWMNIAKQAKKKALHQCSHDHSLDPAKICEQESLLISLQNLRSFPWIEERVQNGSLALHAWRFDLNDGITQSYNAKTESFENL